MRRYNPKDIEPKWQKKWQESGIYKAVDFDPSRPKYVMLTEFPYPSGSGMHIGHMREYTLGDIIARQKRMSGFNVLFPMGYDAFGLPTENYAIKTKIPPQQATTENTKNFQQQLESMGFSFDWSRSFKTSDPDYYKWTQWLFLRFFEAGMAYQEEVAVNWCPFCRTGLANEEVVNGRHERCDTLVEKKLLKQWMLRITDYADRLIDGLADVDYPDWIAQQQINWIGRSKGAEIKFSLETIKEEVSVFTTRPDTLFGATFIALSPEHPLVGEVTTKEQKKVVNAYVREAATKTELERQEAEAKDKTGVFSGSFAINPATGDKIPVWIADYILMGYGTGAIMGVPAHDERDFAFANKYDLPIKYVIEPEFSKAKPNEKTKEAFVAVLHNPKSQEVLMLDWGPRQDSYGGKLFIGGGKEGNEDVLSAARREITEETGYTDFELKAELPFIVHNHFYSNVKKADYYVHIHGLLFDLTSDQQIPTKLDAGEKNEFKLTWMPIGRATAEDATHQYVFDSLMSPAPYTKEGLMTQSGKYNGLSSTLARDAIVEELSHKGLAKERINYRLRDWIFSRQRYWGEPIPIIHCPKHGPVAVADEDLPVILPSVADYLPSSDGSSPLARVKEWVNTTCPLCHLPAKRETDTMPNWAGSSWYYLRYYDPKNAHEFAAKDKLNYWGAVDLYLGGIEHITLHLLYSRFWHQFLFDQGLVPTPEPYLARRSQGIIQAADGSKMSKSKGNVVDPIEVINSGYGADSLRLAVAFLAPYSQTTPWSPESLGGTYRFLQRVWNLVEEYRAADGGNIDNLKLKQVMHRTIKKVSEDLLNMGYNTAVAALMECVNQLYLIKAKDNFRSSEWQWALESLVLLLAPFAPHIAEELYLSLGGQESVHLQLWPGYDEQFVKPDSQTIAVQINGKVRAQLIVPADADQATAQAAAMADPKVQSYLNQAQIIRSIYVKGKLLSLVTQKVVTN